MNKKKMRVIGSFVLIISLSFPMIIVGFQDFYDINKEISLENSQTEDILKEHPVIEGIYKFYQNSSTNSQEYVIKRKDEYTVKEQEKLLQLQTLFSGEIEKLMNHKILSHELLENEDEKYIADYGTLIDDEFCKRVVDVGNFTMSVSIDGSKEVNDERRGEGVYDKIMTWILKLIKSLVFQ